jgi:hypothetical protein
MDISKIKVESASIEAYAILSFILDLLFFGAAFDNICNLTEVYFSFKHILF